MTIRNVFDLVVYFRLEQHHNVGDSVFSGLFIQIKDAFSLGMTSLVNTDMCV